jgi:beta-galactosidase beta subunit
MKRTFSETVIQAICRFFKKEKAYPQLPFHYSHYSVIYQLVNEKGEETPLKAGDFALVNPDEKHQPLNSFSAPANAHSCLT